MKIGYKGSENFNTNQIKYKIMEKILKEFECITQTKFTEGFYTFKAVVMPHYANKYRLIVYSKRYEQGVIRGRNKAELFFDNKTELLNEFEYQYKLCKENLFTDFIEIKK